MVLVDRNRVNLLDASLAGRGTKFVSDDEDDHAQHDQDVLPLLLHGAGKGAWLSESKSKVFEQRKPTQAIVPGGFSISG
jgi:hypothetical protein